MYTESSLQKKLFLVADAIAAVASFVLLSFWFSHTFLQDHLFLFCITILTIGMAVMSDDYSLVHRRNVKQELFHSFSFTIKLLIAFILTLFFSQYVGKVHLHKIGIEFLAIQFIIQFGLVFSFRGIASHLSDFLDTKVKKVILVTNFSSKSNFLETLQANSYDVVAYMSNVDCPKEKKQLPVLRDFDEVREFLQQNAIEEVFIDHDSRQEFIGEQRYFNAIGIPVTVCVATGAFPNLLVQEMGDYKFVTYAVKASHYRRIVVKRMMDILGALVGLVLMALVAMIINPIVQKQSKGPLFFKQKRVGQYGRVFEIYKFRSMYLDAEERKAELLKDNEHSSNLMFKMDNDPRIFPFGQKIRDWSLDELPQFINVLQGEMSLVGTRPPTLEEYQEYDLHHFKRLMVKPGITGMWQVSGRSNITDFEQVVDLDMDYIQRWTIWLDIKILLKTVMVVLKREGSK